jgi:hypothetical protein
MAEGIISGLRKCQGTSVLTWAHCPVKKILSQPIIITFGFINTIIAMVVFGLYLENFSFPAHI